MNLNFKNINVINNQKNYSLFFRLVLICILLYICFFGISVSANSDIQYVYVGGDAIGLDLQTGVYITGKFNTGNKNALNTGDIIKNIDGVEIKNINELKSVLNNKVVGDKISVEFIRNGVEMKDNITVGMKDGKNSIGVYVKDNVLGVGTLTFVDAESLKFGSLGHSACSDLVEINSGNILNCYVNGVKKSVKGIPGEKKAILDKKIIGSVAFNNDYGVFGTLNGFDKTREILEVGNIEDIELGKAYIRTVIEGNKIEEFEIEIIELDKQESIETKGIKYKVTDEELIDKTGGIIQGMSGSPIVQNNQIIGAVSHVIINDPLTGYGVYLEWMLEFL